MKKSGMELIAIAHYSLLFGASGKRHVATYNFLAISCWLLAIAVSLNLVGFIIWHLVFLFYHPLLSVHISKLKFGDYSRFN